MAISVVQSICNSGTTPAFTSAPTAGNLLVLFSSSFYGLGETVTPPSGFELLFDFNSAVLNAGQTTNSQGGLYVFWKISDGSEQSISYSTSGDSLVQNAYIEIFGQATSDIFTYSVNEFDNANTTQAATALGAPGIGYLPLAFFTLYDPTNGDYSTYPEFSSGWESIGPNLAPAELIASSAYRLALTTTSDVEDGVDFSANVGSIGGPVSWILATVLVAPNGAIDALPFPDGGPQLVWFKGPNAQIAGEPYTDYQIVPLWQMTVLNGKGVGLTDLRRFGGLSTGNFPSQANAGPTYINSTVVPYANLQGLLQDLYATTTITNIPTDGSVGRVAWCIRRTIPNYTYPIEVVMTPASMTNIGVGRYLTFDQSTGDYQGLQVTAVTDTTFTVSVTQRLTENPITIQTLGGAFGDTLAQAITVTGDQVVAVSGNAYMVPGDQWIINAGGSNEETVTIEAINTGTTVPQPNFQAYFNNTHSSGEPIAPPYVNTTLVSSDPNLYANPWTIYAETDLPDLGSPNTQQTVEFGYGQVSTGVAYDLGLAFVNTGGFVFSDITPFISNYTSPLSLAIPNHYLLNGQDYEPNFTPGITAYVGVPTFTEALTAVVPTPGANGITTAFELNFTFNNQPQDGSLVGVGCYYRAEGASSWSFYGELPAVGVGGQPSTLPGVGNYQFVYADLSNGIQWQFGANAIGLNNEQSDIFYIAESPAIVPFNTSSTTNLIVDSGLAAGQFHGGSSGFKTGSVCSSNPYWYLFGLHEPNVVISGPGNGTGGSGSFAMDAEGSGRFGGISSPITVIPATEYAISFVCHNQYSSGSNPSIAIVDSTGSNTYTTTYAEIAAPDKAQNQKVNTTWTCPEDGSVTTVAFKADSNGNQANVPGYVIFTEFQMQVAPVSAYSPGPATPGTGTVTQSLKVTPSASATDTTLGSDASDVGNAPSIEAGTMDSVPATGAIGSLYMVTDAIDSSHSLYTAGVSGIFAPVPHSLSNLEDTYINVFNPPQVGQVLTYTQAVSGMTEPAWTGRFAVEKYTTTFTGSASSFEFTHNLNDTAPLFQIYDNLGNAVPIGSQWTAKVADANNIVIFSTAPPGGAIYSLTVIG